AAFTNRKYVFVQFCRRLSLGSEHYSEDLVGDGVKKPLSAGISTSNEIHTSLRTNPHDMLYDASLSMTDQVKTSILLSLQNFRISKDRSNAVNGTYIDILALYIPLSTIQQTIGPGSPLKLCARRSSPEIKIKPAVVQNRFYPNEDYDVEFVRENDIICQSFWNADGKSRACQK
ncbi:hypothetical protein BGW36DRAFT_452280, partial [Talaromyces proteolyticus]